MKRIMTGQAFVYIHIWLPITFVQQYIIYVHMITYIFESANDLILNLDKNILT